MIVILTYYKLTSTQNIISPLFKRVLTRTLRGLRVLVERRVKGVSFDNFSLGFTSGCPILINLIQYIHSNLSPNS